MSNCSDWDESIAKVTSALHEIHEENSKRNSEWAKFLEMSGKDVWRETSMVVECHKSLGFEKNRLEGLFDAAQTRNSTADQILQHIQAINSRLTSGAVKELERTDSLATESLQKLIDNGESTLSKLREDFQLLLNKHRNSFRQTFDCEEMLGKAMDARYEILRDTFRELTKQVQERTDARIRKWMKFDQDGSSWLLEEMRCCQERFTKNDDESSNRFKCHRIVRQRLSQFCDTSLEATAARLSLVERLLSRHQRAAQQGKSWVVRTKKRMDTWQVGNLRQLAKEYENYIDKITQRVEMLCNLEMEMEKQRAVLHAVEESEFSTDLVNPVCEDVAMSDIADWLLRESHRGRIIGVNQESSSETVTELEEPEEEELNAERKFPRGSDHLFALFMPEKSIEASKKEMAEKDEKVTKYLQQKQRSSVLQPGTRVRQLCECVEMPPEDQEEMLLNLLFD